MDLCGPSKWRGVIVVLGDMSRDRLSQLGHAEGTHATYIVKAGRA
jgi:hypothetical protein